MGETDTDQVGRYVLVPRVGSAGRVRRYSLARVGVSRRSALGEDRHERLERIAGLGPDEASPNGAGPPPAPGQGPGPGAP